MKQLEVELLRGRGYPQGDDDADACTTQVRVCVYDADKTCMLAEPQLSSVQSKSNAPFYKDKMVFDIASDVMGTAVVVHVLELSRQRTALAILHGEAAVPLDAACAKHEVRVQLTTHDTVTGAAMNDAHATAHAHAHGVHDSAAASLTMRVALRMLDTDGSGGNDALAGDVDVGEPVMLNGTYSLVPSHGQYVWLSLSSDKRWVDGYTHALLRAWRTRAVLPQCYSNHAASNTGSSNNNNNSSSTGHGDAACACVSSATTTTTTATTATAVLHGGAAVQGGKRDDGASAQGVYSVRGSTATSPAGGTATAATTPSRGIDGGAAAAAAVTTARRSGRSTAPMSGTHNGLAGLSPSLLSSSSTTAAAGGAAMLRSIGDVVTQRWGCRRTHQVLTRVRLTAEKYTRGDTGLLFSPEEEAAYRVERKRRALLLYNLCTAALDAHDTGVLRDALDQAWVLFAVGVDCGSGNNNNSSNGSSNGGVVSSHNNNSSSSNGHGSHGHGSGSASDAQQRRRVLSYEVRRRVHETTFGDEDAVLLQACLLHAFVPSVPYETCQEMAEDDYRAAPLALLPTRSTFDSGEGSATTAQRHFTHVLVLFLGALAETLTSVELVRMLRVYKPAIADAQRRIAAGAKDGISARLSAPAHTSSARPHLGSGIHISHLDKLGRRKNAVQFA